MPYSVQGYNFLFHIHRCCISLCYFPGVPRYHNWRREWQPTPGFLPGKSHGQRTLEGWATVHGSQRVGRDWVTNTFSSDAIFPHFYHNIPHSCSPVFLRSSMCQVKLAYERKPRMKGVYMWWGELEGWREGREREHSLAFSLGIGEYENTVLMLFRRAHWVFLGCLSSMLVFHVG